MAVATLTRKPRGSEKLSFREKNPVRIGVIGVLTIVLSLGALFNAHAIVSLFDSYDLEAVFAEAGGLKGGNDVRLYGRPVGQVTAVKLERDTVVASFQVERGLAFKTGTRAEIKTATALGVKYLALIPEGSGALKAGDRIPLSRTSAPYDVTQALADLTSTVTGVDTGQLGDMLNEVNKTFERTPAELRPALTGVTGLSQALSSRDAELKSLFAQTAKISTVLSKRKSSIQKIITDGDLLAAELTSQRVALDQLISNVNDLTDQLQGFVKDGRTSLRPALIELNDLLDLLQKNRKNFDVLLKGLPLSARGLAESVGSGPFFQAYLGNLAPTGDASGFPILGGGR
jgi:phospholipid/cholesterol/gamma-HCH transport system substrate-binding protein